MSTKKSGLACFVAISLTSYLVLSVFALLAGVTPPLTWFFLPAWFMLAAPAPMLAKIGMAEVHSFFYAPNIYGLAFLLPTYAVLAYFLTQAAVRFFVPKKLGPTYHPD